MSKLAESLKAVLDQLPENDRAALAKHLIDSLDHEDASDEDFDAELAKRLAERRAGAVVGIPAEEVFREFREKHS